MLANMQSTDIFDDIIVVWRDQGYSDIEICWMLTTRIL
jgi:hypothetical protein